MVFVYARPDADTSTGSWKNNLGGAALFSSIDETVVDDSDYIVSAPNTFNDACKISLSNVGICGDPSTVRYRYRKYEGSASDVIDLHVKLLQGTTVIASWDHSDIGTSFTTVDQALTTPQFQSITDFRDLYLTFTTGAWWLDNSSVDLDFQNGRTWDGSSAGTNFTTFLSCTRASIGYAKNSDGTLTSFGTNTLRIGTGTGLLIEDARTNNTPKSQDFSDAGIWNSFANMSITTDTTAAPDGTVTADKITASASSGEHFVGGGAGTTGGLTTGSCYFKAAGYNYGALILNDGASGTGYGIVVNLTTGTTETFSLGSPTSTSASVEVLGNGWFRLISTKDCTSAGYIVMYVYNNTRASGGNNFTGDGVSGVYLWGAQTELAAFASSYIPTTSAAATRAADNIPAISSLDTLLKGSAGSAVVNILTNATAAQLGSSPSVRIIGSSDSANTLLYWPTASGDATVGTYNGGAVLTATFGSSTFNAGAKVGLSWDAGPDRNIVGGGGTVATDANSIGNTGHTHVLGFSTSPNEAMYGYFRRLTAWNSKLADATLQGFTA